MIPMRWRAIVTRLGEEDTSYVAARTAVRDDIVRDLITMHPHNVYRMPLSSS